MNRHMKWAIQDAAEESDWDRDGKSICDRASQISEANSVDLSEWLVIFMSSW